MTIRYFPELVQGTDEWLSARCGLLTASEMKLILTPTLKAASNDKERAHLFELLAQRETRFVEPQYVSFDMERGKEDEIEARALYSRHYAPVTEMGFVTNDRWGFTIGYSPDGLVGDEGAIEAKSRKAKYQVETILGLTVPDEYLLQCQTGLLVSERQWIDFISYSGGLPMIVLRVWPDEKVENAIIEAAGAFEERLAAKRARYLEITNGGGRLLPTIRKEPVELY
jgi:predicted phage-related endonuclease